MALDWTFLITVLPEADICKDTSLQLPQAPLGKKGGKEREKGSHFRKGTQGQSKPTGLANKDKGSESVFHVCFLSQLSLKILDSQHSPSDYKSSMVNHI